MADELADYEAWQAYWGYPDARLPSVPFAVGSHRAITFPATPLHTTCRIALDANLSNDWRSWNWLDISDRVRWQDGVTITSGKRDRDPNVPAATAQFTVTNIDGELSRQNVFSRLFGELFKHNPIWITTDVGNGEFDEFFGFTQELPKRSDRSGTDGKLYMTCKGPLDHVFRNKEKESPLRTACAASVPDALWTLEEEATAVQASSAFSGGAPMQQNGTIQWAATNRVVGALALPNMRSGVGTLVGALPRVLSPGAPGYQFDHNYIVSAVISPEDFASGSWTVFRFRTENQSTIGSWELNVVNDGTLQLVSYSYTNVPTIRSTSAVVPGIFTEPKLVQVTGELLDDVTADARFRIWVNGVQMTTITLAEFTGNFLSVTVTNEDATSEQAALGFIMVHHLSAFPIANGNVNTTPNIPEIVSALKGHVGEMVHERLRRVCRQKGIPFYTSAGVSQRLGPQPIDTPIAVIRDAERVDGVVYEREFGLAYKSTAEYYRQPESLALDMLQGHVLGELQPADDTTKFYNQWTVTRQGGSSSTQQKDGGISENEEIFGNQASFNIETDIQAAYLAAYFANRDSSDADRWPFVKFVLQKHPSLILPYQGMPFGARVTVANMKTRWGVTALNLIAEGKTVFFNSKQYEITINASDANIHNVGQLDGGQVLDARSLVFNSAVGTADTTIDILAGDTLEKLDTGIANYSVDVTARGEVIRISDANPIVEDTFARTEVNTWGVSTSGHTVVSVGGAATDYAVNAGSGKHTLTDVNVMRHSVYASVGLNDVEFYADVRINVLPTDGSISAWLTTRWLDSGNYYDAVLLFRPEQFVQLALGVRAGGLHTLFTDTSTGPSGVVELGDYTVGNFWRIYMRSVGNSLSCKAWEVATQQEPSTFLRSGTPTSTTGVHPIGGDFAVQSRREPGNTNVNPVVEWDNVFSVNPVRCTVTRSINGVVRAHPKGRSIRATDPFILGL